MRNSRSQYCQKEQSGSYHMTSSGLPPTSCHLNDWFNYLDIDRSGKLDKEELVNALQNILQHSDIESLRKIVEDIFPVFDPNGDGLIDREEFIASEGLGESLKLAFYSGTNN